MTSFSSSGNYQARIQEYVWSERTKQKELPTFISIGSDDPPPGVNVKIQESSEKSGNPRGSQNIDKFA